jgi:hypothetical protein
MFRAFSFFVIILKLINFLLDFLHNLHYYCGNSKKAPYFHDQRFHLWTIDQKGVHQPEDAKRLS